MPNNLKLYDDEETTTITCDDFATDGGKCLGYWSKKCRWCDDLL
jgi:hypothetical protein